MKICIVQAKAVKGNIAANSSRHKHIVEQAAALGADIIVFPELSLTGYEPELAEDLAIDPADKRFNVFQDLSDLHKIMIVIGAPTRNTGRPFISLLIFQPQQEILVYSKKYLHADELPFFASGNNLGVIDGTQPAIAFAVCYELSVPAHAENAFNMGAKIYIASVAKTAAGIERATHTLAGIAQKYSMMVVMANCVGYCDNFESAGGSAAWNSKGELLAQLNNTGEALLIFNTHTQEIYTNTVVAV